ncbi:MAG: Omp28-related outer membrane protein [bacterium]
MYFVPWLWYDGNQHGGFDHMVWEALITSRMAMPAPVTIAMWGDYTPGTGQGTVNVYLQNDSTATINGRVIIVITEDSLFYMAPNGINWHNHVPRDYLPDHNGIMVSIPASGYEVVTQPFTVNSLWNDNYCTILAWIQNDSMQVDSTKEIWQGAMKKVTELGIEETDINAAINQFSLSPNPCRDRVEFAIDLPSGIEYRVNIYDILGRQVRGLMGVSTGKHTIVEWDLNANNGKKTGAGVYLYEFISSEKRTSGKIIIK